MLRADRVWGTGHVTKISQAKKMAKNLMNLKRCISVITDIDDKWFVIFERTINHLSFGYDRLPQHENYSSCFAFFFLDLFFFFLLPLSTFKPLNALYSKFERLKISRKTFARPKSGVPGRGNPPQSGPPKF